MPCTFSTNKQTKRSKNGKKQLNWGGSKAFKKKSKKMSQKSTLGESEPHLCNVAREIVRCFLLGQNFPRKGLEGAQVFRWWVLASEEENKMPVSLPRTSTWPLVWRGRWAAKSKADHFWQKMVNIRPMLAIGNSDISLSGSALAGYLAPSEST